MTQCMQRILIGLNWKLDDNPFANLYNPIYRRDIFPGSVARMGWANSPLSFSILFRTKAMPKGLPVAKVQLRPDIASCLSWKS